MTFIPGRSTLAVVDATLSGVAAGVRRGVARGDDETQDARASAPLGPNEIGIDNFSFTPPTLTVKAGTKVTWINNDDVPHLIVNVQSKFKPSPVLDTDQRFSATLTKPGTYNYFCSLHPKMQGVVIVN